MGHNTPTARKTTPNFIKSSSLVGFGPILNEIQPFKNIKILLRSVWIAGRDGQFVRRPYVFHNKIWILLNGCISSNIGLINTKLDDVVKFGVFFLAMWVLVSYPIIHRLIPSPPRYEIRQWRKWQPCSLQS